MALLAGFAAVHLAWAEVSIRSGELVRHSSAAVAASALESGTSVLLVPGAATEAECAAVVQSCSAALEGGQGL
eukprot:781236-Prymnesium_polylepis.1